MPADGIEAVQTASERAARQAALNERAEAKARKDARADPDTPETRADLQAMRRSSEQIGEAGASVYVRSQFPKAERVVGTPEGQPGQDGQFDQVWVEVDGDTVRFIVPEAKGGGSGTGTALVEGRPVAQGNPE